MPATNKSFYKKEISLDDDSDISDDRLYSYDETKQEKEMMVFKKKEHSRKNK